MARFLVPPGASASGAADVVAGRRSTGDARLLKTDFAFVLENLALGDLRGPESVSGTFQHEWTEWSAPFRGCE